jgi:LDH2 family malate/lactate/ureidoglycolate dehydrogenase
MLPDDKVTWIDFDLLERFMADVFIGVGVPADEARMCANVLIASDKRGIDSHGIGRMKSIYYDRIRLGIQNPHTEFEIVKEGPTTAVVDAHDGMGMVASVKSMRMAMDKAKRYGMGMVAVRNSTHYGFCGYYPLMAIQEGMIGITGTNARPSIAPTFGVENMLGTNPLVFGFPTDEDFPFVIDCATSVSQRGKLEVYDRADKDLPEGWVIDRTGHYRTDTKQILKDLVKGTAALVPLGGMGEDTGGHKGYGYATVVEILSSALQDGEYLKGLLGFDAEGKPRPYHLGHFFIAIDVEAFITLDRFKLISGSICRALRASDKAPGHQRIWTAGEKEHDVWLERKDRGAPVNEELKRQMIAMRQELGLTQYRFPFDSL